MSLSQPLPQLTSRLKCNVPAAAAWRRQRLNVGAWLIRLCNCIILSHAAVFLVHAFRWSVCLVPEAFEGGIADVVVEHPSSSRLHAVLQFNGETGDAFLYDAASAHGTLLNRRRIKSGVHVPLR